MNNTPKTTFLGPVGATFSHDAYNVLAGIYGVPEAELVPASQNGDILSMVASHGGYGAIAMETLAEGRVAEPLESFIALLMPYYDNTVCPFHVVGAVGLKLHFCLMVRKGVKEVDVTRIIGHTKAIGACKERIGAKGTPTEEVKSNGEGARLVAEDDNYATCAALGPRSAAEKYGLEILDAEFEDREAVTTFFLVAPKVHKKVVGKNNRVLIVFEVAHSPGSLVKALISFYEEKINMIQIHSVHVANGLYHFAIELEVDESGLSRFEEAVKKFHRRVERYLVFGPFEVVAR